MPPRYLREPVHHRNEYIITLLPLAHTSLCPQRLSSHLLWCMVAYNSPSEDGCFRSTKMENSVSKRNKLVAFLFSIFQNPFRPHYHCSTRVAFTKSLSRKDFYSGERMGETFLLIVDDTFCTWRDLDPERYWRKYRLRSDHFQNMFYYIVKRCSNWTLLHSQIDR